MPRPADFIAKQRREKSLVSPTSATIAMVVDKIAKLETEDSIPVIIAIINDIQDKLSSDQTDEMQSTKACLVEADRILKETDEKQNLGKTDQIKYFSTLTRDKIIGPLDHLSSTMQNIRITATTADLWQEAAIWLKGLFKHTDVWYEHDTKTQEVKRDAAKKPVLKSWQPLVSLKESAIAVCNTNMWEIASYYLSCSNTIEAKLKETHVVAQAQSADADNDVIETPVGVASMETSADFACISVSPAENSTSLVTFRVANSHVKRLRQLMEQAFVANPLQEKLMQVPDTDVEEKIRVLRVNLGKYGLTDEQKLELKYWSDQVIAHAKKYKAGGGIQQYLINRPNADLADRLIEELPMISDIAICIDSVCAILCEVIGRDSHELKKELETVLLNACRIICNTPPYIPRERIGLELGIFGIGGTPAALHRVALPAPAPVQKEERRNSMTQ